MPPDELRRGRPRSTIWVGKLGAFLNEYTPGRLAGELDLDPMQIYRWARGDYQPSIRKAIAIVEIAKATGAGLTLEDIYEREVARIRVRMRDSLPPL
jgi:DNA-binding XRE family transcriptional regulator